MRAIFSALAMVLCVAATPSHGKTLRVGLGEDPDVLDPTLGRTFVGRIVLQTICDKLFDTDEKLNFVPQLALSYEWAPENRAITFKLRQGVKFQDGTPFDAEAVKFNIERSLTFPGSNRKSEINAVEGAEVLDPATVRLNLKTPFVPLMGALADRGMMVSPSAAKAAGNDFGARPVCAGPYKFVERVQQDRIVVERFDGYWNRDKVRLDRIVFRPIPDASVRLANLQSGDLDFIERLSATDIPAVKSNPRLRLASITSIGYQGITFNLAHGERAKTPLGSDPRIREAFDLALDRKVITDVVFNGEYTPGNEWVPPSNPFYVKTGSIERDLARAKELLKAAGAPRPTVMMMITTDTQGRAVGQVVQQMVAEAGFDLRLEATEFATALGRMSKGDFEAFLIGWSGASDVDRNLYQFIACDGSINESRYCNPEVDALLAEERAAGDPQRRREILGKIAALTIGRDRPLIYLYHVKWLYAHSAKLTGFAPYPDGIARLNFVDIE
jgi:peptide/nickel transport system substrate-binding protein